MKNKLTISFLVIISFLLCGWGSTGHKIINSKTVLAFPQEMSQFDSWQTFLADHASDADYRKSSDKNEGPKHYIDIDSYSEFNNTGRIIQDYDSIVTKYGSSYVIGIGVLPWAIINSYDSLKAQFERRDWNKAKQTAADLGHYVADSHQPLHITKNYNGYDTNQGGIHSRYESGVINDYQNLLQYTPDTAKYISDVPDFVFNYIYGNYSYVDSVLKADKDAHAFAGNTNSTEYYQKMWELTGNFTIQLFSNASYRLSSLIYTAWKDAGSPDLNSTAIQNINNVPAGFKLYQNYPNPFNPSTQIVFNISKDSHVKLTVFDTAGKEVKILVDENKAAGNYSVNFNISSLTYAISSGVYLYRISAGKYSETKKMILMK